MLESEVESVSAGFFHPVGSGGLRRPSHASSLKVPSGSPRNSSLFRCRSSTCVFFERGTESKKGTLGLEVSTGHGTTICGTGGAGLRNEGRTRVRSGP